MLNKTTALNIANKILGPEKVNAFGQIFDAASGIMNAANNPREVIEKAGITKADLEKAKKCLNNPFSGWVISAFGGNKEAVLKGLDTAEQFFRPDVPVNTMNDFNKPLGSPAEQAPVSELESLRNDLKQLR